MRPRITRSAEGRLLGAVELQGYISMGRNGARKLAEDAGAVVKIGNRVLFDRLKIDAYIDHIREEQQV